MEAVFLKAFWASIGALAGIATAALAVAATFTLASLAVSAADGLLRAVRRWRRRKVLAGSTPLKCIK